MLAVNGGTLEETKHFSYLGNVFDCEGGVERAVRGRVATAWMKWRNIASLLMNDGVRQTAKRCMKPASGRSCCMEQRRGL